MITIRSARESEPTIRLFECWVRGKNGDGGSVVSIDRINDDKAYSLNVAVSPYLHPSTANK